MQTLACKRPRLGLMSHQQAVWCRILTHCLFLLNFVCIHISLQTLSSVLVEACLAAPVFLGQITQALHTWTQGDSANLLCRSSKAPSGWRGYSRTTNFFSLPGEPRKDTGDVSKPLLCCLGLLGSRFCWKANLQLCWRFWEVWVRVRFSLSTLLHTSQKNLISAL